jgi:hypothetical protein
MPSAGGQSTTWDVSRAREVNTPLSDLPPADRTGIARRLHARESSLRAERVEIPGGRLFFVQGFGRDFCGGTGNCSFSILTSDFKVVLSNAAQAYQIQITSHNGLPDIVTSMHDSAFESLLKLWQFNGRYYERNACADALFADQLSGKTFRHPRITQQPCKQLFGR